MKNHFGYYNARLAGQMHWHLEKALGPFEVTASQYAVMLAIADGATKPGEIAEALDVDAGAITRILDRMGEKNLLSRCDSVKKEDRRCVAIELSPEGKALVPRIRKAADQLDERLLSDLPQSHRKQLMKIIQDLYEKSRSMP